MNLERTYVEWAASRGNQGQVHTIVADAAAHMLELTDDNMRWLQVSLTDEKRKMFTAALLAASPAIPDKLYAPLIRAAVYEISPLRVQAFVEPCVKAFTKKKVYQSFIDYVEKGTDYEKAGAVNALHWVSQKKTTAENEKHKPDMAMMQYDDYRRMLYLNTFLKNSDLDLRRSIITYVDLDKLNAPPAAQELIDKVIKAARAHSDEYIKNRVEVQLGRIPSAYPLPSRKPIDATESTKRSWWQQLWK